MITSARTQGLCPRLLVYGVTVLAGVSAARGQQTSPQPDQDLKTRQLWDDAFTESRPAAAKPVVRPQPPRPSVASAPRDSFLGVTLWRLQRAEPPDAAKGITIASGPNETWLPMRTEVGAGLAEGQRVRLTLESSVKGYLYVIDREQYADGSSGEPYLIFPTIRIREGNNEVKAGQVVEIPDLADRPPFFTMKRSRPDEVGEVLTVLITSAPLPGLQIGRSPQALSREQVQEWERKWSAPTKQLELVGGAGRPYTKAEREAGENQTRLLTQEDPLPQTMYRVTSKSGEPVMVAVPLKIKMDVRN